MKSETGVVRSTGWVKVLLIGILCGMALLVPTVAKRARAADFTIRGNVYDEANQPIENIRVTVKRFLYYDNFERPVWGEVISGTTSLDGTYSLIVPDVGPFRIEFADAISPRRYHGEFFDDKTSLETSSDVLIAEGSLNAVANAQLTAIQPITGHVTDEGGNPLADIRVSTFHQVGDPKLEHLYWGTATSATTDASGAYTLTAPEDASFRIGFEDASSTPRYVTEYYENAGYPQQAINILFDKDHPTYVVDAQLAVGSVITGQVVDSNGTPVSLAAVFAGIPVPDQAGQVFLQEGRQTTSDINGYYTLTLPLSGTVGVGVMDNIYPNRFGEQYYNHVPLPQQPTSVTVSIGEITPNINLQVPFYGVISGQVTDKNGDPISKITVSAHRLMSDTFGNEFWFRFSQVEVTDAQGRYELPVWTEDAIRLCFKMLAYPGQFDSFIPRCYGSSLGDPATGTDLSIQMGQVITGVDIQLGEYAQVSGKVTGSNGEPLQGVSVNAVDIVQHEDGTIEPIGSVDQGGSTDSNGNYTFTVFSQGNFVVSAYPGLQSQYATEYYEKQVDIYHANILTSEADAVIHVDFQLSLKGSISGTVTDLAGLHLANIAVTAFRYGPNGTGGQAWMPFAGATTDENGVYTITQVMPGDYRVGFGLNQDYAPQFYPYTTTVEAGSNIVLGLGESAGNIDGQLSPLQNTLSIQLNSTPKSIRNLHFTSALGDFALDDPALDDGDAYTQAVSFTLTSAVYSFTLALPSDRYLQGVSCDGTNGPEVSGTIFQIALSGGKSVTCTIQVALGAAAHTFSYHDANGDGMFNEGETPQSGITVTVHNVTTGVDLEQVSNEGGLTEFVNLPPVAQFYVCQTPPQDWVNSQPGTIDGQFNSPCYANALQAGQLATVHFGNIEANDPDFTNTPSTSPDGFVISDAPLVNDTDEEGEVQMNVYLPVVSR